MVDVGATEGSDPILNASCGFNCNWNNFCPYFPHPADLCLQFFVLA